MDSYSLRYADEYWVTFSISSLSFWRFRLTEEKLNQVWSEQHKRTTTQLDNDSNHIRFARSIPKSKKYFHKQSTIDRDSYNVYFWQKKYLFIFPYPQIDNPVNENIEDESVQEKEIHITHIITEILRHQFFRKIDFPVTKYDCLLDVCDNLIKESRRRQENRFKRTAYQIIDQAKDKV